MLLARAAVEDEPRARELLNEARGTAAHFGYMSIERDAAALLDRGGRP